MHRPRLLASLSNYELGRRFWQQQDYQKSLEVVEWSIAYKLFPYEVSCCMSAAKLCFI